MHLRFMQFINKCVDLEENLSVNCQFLSGAEAISPKRVRALALCRKLPSHEAKISIIMNKYYIYYDI